ncbi:TRAP-type C4-dicarboxylate transport system permease small subunit [Amorphus suaedae]
MILSPLPRVASRLRQAASLLATAAMIATFALFIYGVGMRYLADQPVRWVDEAVTLLTTWLVFWAGAFVLDWSEFISFDVVYRLVPPAGRRLMVLLGAIGFVGVIGASIYGIVDYVLFMHISTTDMLTIPLDRVYSIFVVFLIAISLRLLVLIARLLFGDWRRALAELDGRSEESL